MLARIMYTGKEKSVFFQYMYICFLCSRTAQAIDVASDNPIETFFFYDFYKHRLQKYIQTHQFLSFSLFLSFVARYSRILCTYVRFLFSKTAHVVDVTNPTKILSFYDFYREERNICRKISLPLPLSSSSSSSNNILKCKV